MSSFIDLVNDSHAMDLLSVLDTGKLEIVSLGHFEKYAVSYLHITLPERRRSSTSYLDLCDLQ